MTGKLNEKDCFLTTLAIIGDGILGRSLLYTLAKEQKLFEKIVLFHSDAFAFPCTRNSTAIVAPRGVTEGHSPLGDLIVEGVKTFKEHVELDRPAGVLPVPQYSGATTKLDTFIKRYPDGKMMKGFFHEETYVATEEAFMVDAVVYGDWLLSEAMKMEPSKIEIIDDFVIEVNEGERLHLKTQNGRNVSFDKVVFAGGNYNRFWKGLVPGTDLETSRPVQGSYFEYNGVEWDTPSFSLTLNGDNLVWNNETKRLLVGNTTMETNIVLPDIANLRAVHKRLSDALVLDIPGPELGEVKVGLRDKARKRAPYIVKKGNLIFAGGLYKNGFILGLRISRILSHQHL